MAGMTLHQRLKIDNNVWLSKNEALSEAARREGEVLVRLKNALKDKRLVIIVGAGVTLHATADVSGTPSRA